MKARAARLLVLCCITALAAATAASAGRPPFNPVCNGTKIDPVVTGTYALPDRFRRHHGAGDPRRAGVRLHTDEAGIVASVVAKGGTAYATVRRGRVHRHRPACAAEPAQRVLVRPQLPLLHTWQAAHRLTPRRATGPARSGGVPSRSIAAMTRYLHTMVRITDPAKSRAFYEALGLEFRRDMDIVRNGETEATNYFFGVPGQDEELELTFNHDGRTYELGTAYGHVAYAVDDLAATLEALAAQGIEPEREPYRVREGGSLLCFVQDPDGYRIELIDRSGK